MGLDNIRRKRLAGAIVLMATIFFLDWVTPLSYADWLGYLFPVFIIARSERPRYGYLVTAICTVLIGLAAVLSPFSQEPLIALVNRTLGTVVLWVMALLVSRLRQMQESLSQARDRLESQVEERTIELTQTNQALQAEIVERKRAEEQIESVARFPSENPHPVLRLNRDGTILYTNEASASLLHEWECQVGSPAPQVYRDQAIQALNSQSRNTIEIESAGQVYLFVIVPVVEAGYVNFYGTDITERKRAQEERERLLKELAAAEERQRLARDLHDAVSQNLFSVSLLADVLPRIWERNPTEARQRTEELHRLADGALAEMRMLLLELRPAALTDTPLGDLLRHLAKSVGARARFSIQVITDGNHPVPPDVQMGLYRIAQEALNNMLKHARASQASIRLNNWPDRVELQVADNGHGFDSTNAAGEHMGLRIMRERAESIGAVLRVDSQVGYGTVVNVAWPNTQKIAQSS